MTRGRSIVGMVAAAAVVVSGTALAVPATAYGPASSALKCRLYFGDAGVGSSPSTYTDSFTLTASPAAPVEGATVTVTLAAAAGPINGPIEIAPGTMVSRAVIDRSGAQTGDVPLASPPYPAATTSPYTPMGAWTATGTYIAGAGTTTLSLKQVKFDDTAFNVDTYCADAGADADFKASGGAVSSTIVQSVLVTKDTVKPTAALLLPAKAKRVLATSWKTVRGVAADTGRGPKSVQVWLTQKRGPAFYYFTGRGWAKATGAKVAVAKAKRIGVAVAANKTWALGTKGIVKGTLTVGYRPIDKAGNIGAAKAHVQLILR